MIYLLTYSGTSKFSLAGSGGEVVKKFPGRPGCNNATSGKLIGY
jgi:hypothetical protein